MSDSSGSAAQRRRSVRYKPEPGTIARIDPLARPGDFQGTITGLVINESYSGCCVITGMNPLPEQGSICRVQLGQFAPLRAEVRWRVELDQDVLKLGLSYLD